MVSSKRRSGKLKDPEGMDVDVEEAPSNEEDTESTPKFEVKERVYAQDASSSLWYEAVIRRSLFGVHHNKQVQIGLVSSESEIEEILAQSEAPGWHYFVHYNKWNTNWDRWVSEEDIMEQNERSKRIADRYQMEHKLLTQELKKKGKGRGDGTAFLNAWSKRMEKVAEELKQETGGGTTKKAGKQGKDSKKGSKSKGDQQSSSSDGPGKDKPKPKKRSAADKWDKAAIQREYKLRLRGLEGKRSSQDQHKMTLPFSLKKVMVEAWEIITQCKMVPNLPVKFTVRQGLDKYLQSKLELIVPTTTAKSNPTIKDSPTKSPGPAATKEEDQISEEEKLEKRRQEWKDMVEGIAMFFDEALPFRLLYSQELSQFKLVENTLVVPMTDDETTKNPTTKKDVKEEVAETSKEKTVGEPSPGGDDKMQVETENTTEKPVSEAGSEQAAMETPKSADEEKSNNNIKKKKASTRKMLPSEIYGCEHLLRLCLKVPELLAEQMPTPATDDENGLDILAAYEHESKQILAKVNDLIRFLHKHQSTMFADSYRKLNEAEIREDQKFMRTMERKRKRSNEEAKAEAATTASNPEAEMDTTGTVSTDIPAAPVSKQQKVN